MKYSICHRVEGHEFPLLYQEEFDSDYEAKYFALTHRRYTKQFTLGMERAIDHDLEEFDPQFHFVFWIYNEDKELYTFMNHKEDDRVWNARAKKGIRNY